MKIPFIATSIFLSACASFHQVNLEELAAAQNQIFHVRSVTINCEKLAEIANTCSADCQRAILNNIPTADITKILSASYGITIAQEDNLSFLSYEMVKDTKDAKQDAHLFEPTKISMGNLKISFHAEDILVGLLTSDGKVDTVDTCSYLWNYDYHDSNYYINIGYTIIRVTNPFHDNIELAYNVSVEHWGTAHTTAEQSTIVNPHLNNNQSTTYIQYLITQRGKIDSIANSSNSNDILEGIKNAAMKIPAVLERDIKAYQASPNP
ncbi:MAG TPA: hypothetical protein VK654_03685 [Nitrospirota bacterium]|nr:hypothetical protein [Nitrospirota bacterium]